VDHATVDDTMDRLVEARKVLGYDDSAGLAGEPSTTPSRDDVLYAGDVLARAVEGLMYLQTAHGGEEPERAKADAIRATEQADLDQSGAAYRDSIQ
jgi:hypothetical protein